jgi:GNAT superfamily N-acetyltransferase
MLRLESNDLLESPESKAIIAGLQAFNDTHRRDDWRPLTLTFKEGEEVVAGLYGYSDWGWLFVKWLWVAEARRGQDLGTRLMREAEAEALRRGCHSAWLDTFGFQAPGFYAKLGYEVFGELADYPLGHSRFFLRKKL